MNAPLPASALDKRSYTWERKGVLLIIDREHLERVLAIKAGKEGIPAPNGHCK